MPRKWISCRSASRRMTLSITRVKPVPVTLKPIAMSLTRGGGLVNSSTRAILSRREEQAEPFERAVGPDVPGVGHAETRVAEEAGELLDREPGDTIGVEDERVRRPILADLQE